MQDISLCNMHMDNVSTIFYYRFQELRVEESRTTKNVVKRANCQKCFMNLQNIVVRIRVDITSRRDNYLYNKVHEPTV